MNGIGDATSISESAAGTDLGRLPEPELGEIGIPDPIAGTIASAGESFHASICAGRANHPLNGPMSSTTKCLALGTKSYVFSARSPVEAKPGLELHCAGPGNDPLARGVQWGLPPPDGVDEDAAERAR